MDQTVLVLCWQVTYDNRERTVCVCDDDECNGADAKSPTGKAVVMMAAAALVLLAGAS